MLPRDAFAKRYTYDNNTASNSLVLVTVQQYDFCWVVMWL